MNSISLKAQSNIEKLTSVSQCKPPLVKRKTFETNEAIRAKKLASNISAFIDTLLLCSPSKRPTKTHIESRIENIITQNNSSTTVHSSVIILPNKKMCDVTLSNKKMCDVTLSNKKMRECKKCGIKYPKTFKFFKKCGIKADCTGYNMGYVCAKCRYKRRLETQGKDKLNEQQKLYYAQNKEKHKARVKAYYEKNKKKISEKNKARTAEKKRRLAEYLEKNKT